MTILSIILWILALAVVPLLFARIVLSFHRGPGDEKGALIFFVGGITLVLYLIVSVLIFFLK